MDQHLDLPAGYRVEWTGQYENQIRAQKTLSVIVPIVVVVILFLLFIAYRDAGLVAIVSLAIPFGLIG
ncbi:MAG TPA: efflux RND transporter permease subunit [bacterium]|nr:efflux RND transporter permease subunit [bacterium]